MGRVTRRDRGGLEKEVVAVLAAAGRPLTPSEVQAELGGGLARCGTWSPWSSTSPAWAPRGPLPGWRRRSWPRPRVPPGPGYRGQRRSIAGGLDLTSAEALDLGAYSLILFREQLGATISPAWSASLSTLTVGKDNGCEDPIGDLLRRLREEPAASPVDSDPWLVSDGPRVVTGRDLKASPRYMQRVAAGRQGVVRRQGRTGHTAGSII